MMMTSTILLPTFKVMQQAMRLQENYFLLQLLLVLSPMLSNANQHLIRSNFAHRVSASNSSVSKNSKL